jgi:hypothetical protein
MILSANRSHFAGSCARAISRNPRALIIGVIIRLPLRQRKAAV